MRRYMLISADTHAGVPTERFRPYLDPEYREPFDEYVDQLDEMRKRTLTESLGEQLFDDKFSHEFRDEAADRVAGAWDPERRNRELEGDGVVGEIIFPDGQNENGPPFGATGRLGDSDPRLRLAGARAYNRWLAELCAHSPERRAGVAITPIDDIEAAVSEIQWAKSNGLRGGILIPSMWGDLPAYNDPRYEPIWATCEELGMTVHTHGGAAPSYGGLPGSVAIYTTEVTWWSHRPFWFALWSGVFERHPELKFVLTEQSACWVPDTLYHMDVLYDGPMFAQIRKDLSLKPSEYWARQCWVGASFMRAHETAMRHQIGIDKIMWGNDYPHMEGTWPHTAEKMRAAFGGIPADEVRPMVGENAARVYGFEEARLAPIVERVGPEKI
ncbi:MAG: amidohydrolase [Chloroflexi bacterium]|nr:amidohydrolase [Chloroflexota bacterium]